MDRNETESGVLESTEKRMKSVDRDFGPFGFGRFNRTIVYLFAAMVALIFFVRLWKDVHRNELSFFSVMDIVTFTLGFISPLFVYYSFMKYLRSAMKENLVSERVTKNCEFYIGLLMFMVYLAFMSFSERF